MVDLAVVVDLHPHRQQDAELLPVELLPVVHLEAELLQQQASSFSFSFLHLEVDLLPVELLPVVHLPEVELLQQLAFSGLAFS